MKSILIATFITVAGISGTASADSVSFHDGLTTVRIEGVNIQVPADRTRVIEALRAAAASTCRDEPTRVDRRACADEFAAAAIGDLAEAPLRTALLQTLTGDGAVAVASVE